MFLSGLLHRRALHAYPIAAVVLAVSAGSTAYVMPSIAANVIFQATVTDDNNGGGGGGPTDPDPDLYACIIEVQQAGGFGSNFTNTAFDSELPGGVPAVVQVTSVQLLTTPTSGFELSFDAPPGFSLAPAGGNVNTTFSTRFSGVSITDGVNFPLQSGSTSVTLPDSGVSVSRITGHLRGEKSDGPFPEGNYEAEAVMRCE